jgi:hypothetical protein
MGGTKGNCLVISCVPDSTFKTEITALIAAGTKVVGKLVSLTFSANYEVTSPAGGAVPDGEILSYNKTTNAAGVSYILSVALFSYIDQNSVRHTPVCVRTIEYDGTIALQDSIMIDDTTYRKVEDGGTGGWGAVIAKDTTNTTVDVLF